MKTRSIRNTKTALLTFSNSTRFYKSNFSRPMLLETKNSKYLLFLRNRTCYYRKLERPADVRVIWSLENLFSGKKNSDRRWLRPLFLRDLSNKLN